MKENLCNCGSGKPSWWIYDAHGIPLCNVCDKCEDEQRARFRPETFNDSNVYGGNYNAFGEALEPEY